MVNKRLAERINERIPKEIEIITPKVSDDEELASLARRANEIGMCLELF